MLVTRRFSLTNFAIATSALCFQVLVLYPWHKRLDEDFKELKKEHLRVLQSGERARIAELREIRDGLNRIGKKEMSREDF
jgi:hypothetical protein